MTHEQDVLSQLVDYHDHISAPPVPVADDLHRGRRRVGRNRGLLAGGVALAVVSVVAAASLFTGGRDSDPPQPADPPGLTMPLVAPNSLLDVSELGFHVEPAPDLVVTGGWDIDLDRQSTGVQVSGGDSNGMNLRVEVYYEGRPLQLPRAGAREPSKPPRAGTRVPVTVNGVPGTYIEIASGGRSVCAGYDEQISCFHAATLAWEYAPDSWAAVTAGWVDRVLPSDLRSKMLTAAEAVRPGGQAVRLPIRFGAIPSSLPDLATARLISSDTADGGWDVQVWQGGLAILVGTPGGLADDGQHIQVRVGDTVRSASVDETVKTAAYPIADLKKMLREITVAPSNDEATWFDLTTALGG